MPLIPFPDIPDLPGVPALPRLPEIPDVGTVVQSSLGAVQSILWDMFQNQQSQWGIYDSAGNALGDSSLFSGLLGDALDTMGMNGSMLSTNSVEYSKETRVSDYPVEQGGFASYNKVEMPGNAMVQLCFMGSEADKTAFLDEIDAACISIDPYSVVTPEKNYIGYSIERYNYQRRSNRGATLLIIELSLKEIRVVTAKYTKATQKEAGAVPSEDNGKIQAKTPDESVLKSMYNWVDSKGILDSFQSLFSSGATP